MTGMPGTGKATGWTGVTRWQDPQWRRDAGFAAACCVSLALYNNVAGGQAWHRRWYPLVNAGAAAGLLTAAAGGGLRAGDLGLSRGNVAAGSRLGALAAAPVAAGWLAAAFMPAVRPLLRDARIDGASGRDATYQALVRIPVGTALWEETAFRGVLQAALRRVLPGAAASAVACGVFGIWHIRPTLEAVRANQLATGPAATVAAVSAGAAATAAAGGVLLLLRERSGSLAAPFLLHVSTNCPGPLAAWAVARWAGGVSRRRERRSWRRRGRPAGPGPVPDQAVRGGARLRRRPRS